MKKYVCSVCGYIYDEEKGIPTAGIKPGTRWEDLPEEWECPICKASKSAFNLKNDESLVGEVDVEELHVDSELSAMEMSIICSNLARGCEKQYLEKEAQDFRNLAEFFKSKSEKVVSNNFESIKELILSDLEKGYPYTNSVSKKETDRGAMRSLVWSEKVTNMHKSLIARYEAEGEKMLDNTGVWVCTICGFIYVGDKAPELCPVCKVPSWKFEKAERRI